MAEWLTHLPSNPLMVGLVSFILKPLDVNFLYKNARNVRFALFRKNSNINSVNMHVVEIEPRTD